ncbi:MAG: helix-turn-helix transcriptional regulator [Lachnospiraceae bacterium]|jgi:DNA-binding XRE family transcriptional regulator|nr:helix-turn-helix transcriptional regulator [Lachnospiraceae bacterium]
MKKWNDIEAKFLDNPDIKAEFEALRPHYEIVAQIIKARNEQGLTQEGLAKRSGIARCNISRLESGTYNPSLALLNRVAHGLGMEVHVEFRAPQTTVR